jgi:hypothetical protein
MFVGRPALFSDMYPTRKLRKRERYYRDVIEAVFRNPGGWGEASIVSAGARGKPGASHPLCVLAGALYFPQAHSLHVMAGGKYRMDRVREEMGTREEGAVWSVAVFLLVGRV